MGGSIVPMLVDRGQAEVYDFSLNEVPGATARDKGYWRDVGTLDAYYDAHMDLISIPADLQPLQPRLADPVLSGSTAAGQVHLRRRGAPRPRHRLDGVRRGRDLGRRRAALDPLARRAPALLQRGRGLDPHARRRRRRNAVVRRAIVDKDVRIEPGAQIGVDPDADRDRFVVSDGGVVVVGKGDGRNRLVHALLGDLAPGLLVLGEGPRSRACA
jgi:glucose-1-phosphate adenylyltransferase